MLEVVAGAAVVVVGGAVVVVGGAVEGRQLGSFVIVTSLNRRISYNLNLILPMSAAHKIFGTSGDIYIGSPSDLCITKFPPDRLKVYFRLLVSRPSSIL